MKTPPLTPEDITALHRSIEQICDDVAADLRGHLKLKAHLLTADEVARLRGSVARDFPKSFYRLVRILVCALAAERIELQWQAESTRADTKRVRRWLRGRQCPLKDGDSIKTGRGLETVAGEIKATHAEPVCYTVTGNWYRRSDGEPMTGWNGEVMTVSEFYRRRRAGEIDRHP